MAALATVQECTSDGQDGLFAEEKLKRSSATSSRGPVTVTYEALRRGDDLTTQIQEAYGPAGLGILLVEGVPRFLTLKHDLLPLAHRTANLPAESLKKYEFSPPYVGWSHGKETMKTGVVDTLKGSWYCHPTTNVPTSDPELIKEHGGMYTPNVWPTDEVPDLEHAFMAMGKLIIHVGEMVARQCDAVCSQANPDHGDIVQRMVRDGVPKGRLLYYFPQAQRAARTGGRHRAVSNAGDSWCGWHNDHSALTGLASAGLYFDEEGNVIPNPDPEHSGLKVISRDGRQLSLGAADPSCMAFQIGETSQLLSGGILQATPHAVVGCGVPGVSRGQFAVFMQPAHDFIMSLPQEADIEKVQDTKHLPSTVPSLASRWEPDISFGEYSQRTWKAYYQ